MAADAESENIDTLLAGGLLNGIQSCQRAVSHVVIETLVGQFLVRVDPGHDEDRVPLINSNAL